MENTVEYRVFLTDAVSKETGSPEASLSAYLAFLAPLIGDYIWQKEPFALRVRSPEKVDGPACLYGKTNFGENIDDEWFIVFLLFQLSKKFPETCISIHDNDGEFLLIEVAHFLPRWLRPETSQNRVFIHDDALHIIPIPSTPGEVTALPIGTPSVSQAIGLVCGSMKTTASEKVQQALESRIRGFPEKALESFHHAHCYIPAAVRFVLEQNPALISPAVQAFYERDPADLKACRRMKYFPPDNRVMARVRFTKCLYAQLAMQNFAPEARSGWTLPAVASPLYKAHSLGMKLAYGFEILCSRANGGLPGFQEEGDPCGAKWEKFLSCLKQQGYFKGELDGSKLHKGMLQRAKNHFRDSFSTQEQKAADPGSVVLSLIQNNEFDGMRSEGAEGLSPEDDDSWLEISPQDVDNMLAGYNNSTNGNDKKSCEAPFDLGSVTHSMKSFVDKISSHEGAEFPWTADHADVQFNADSFLDTMQKLLEDRPAGPDSDDDQLSISSSDEESGEETTAQDEVMKSYMEQMDRELAGTAMAKTFEKEQGQAAKAATTDGAENKQSHDDESSAGKMEGAGGEEEQPPVDVDLNLVKNLLDSFTMQQGLAGPASNILRSMGVELPQDSDAV